MSELHMGLIGLGALGVLGVVVYNAWVAYRHRQLAGRLLDPLEKDVLFDKQAVPPGFAPETEAAAESEWESELEDAAEDVSEDVFEDVPELSPASPETASAPSVFARTDGAEDDPQIADDQAPEVATEMPAAPAASAAEAASVSASFAAAASRWLSALHLPRSSGEASSSEAEASVRERIEPALGHAAADIADEDRGSGADLPEIDDTGEFGEILESRPYGESGQTAAMPLPAGHGHAEYTERTEYTEYAEHGAAKTARTIEADGGASAAAHEAVCEPVQGSASVPDASAWGMASAAAGAVDAAVPDALVAAEDAPAGVSEPMHLLSPAIDYIATLETAVGVPAADWLAAQQATLSRADKPVHWAGFDEENGEWVMLGADVARGGGEPRLFRHVRAGLQLADRRGALSENDLLIFATAMDALAREWQAQGRPVMLDLPDPRPVPAAAADLDAFCVGVDIQISLNVIALNEAFPGTQVRALAESAGMFLDGRGRFVRVTDDGSVLYMLLNHDPAGFSAENMRATSVQGLTFLFDVPTVARGERVFGQLADLAGRFADVLKGALVDDNRRPLSEASLAPISQQIAQFQASMAQRNLPAGGRMARRLFS
ncbi:cell division protein ZipA C-terminal FtsZ-binding domain-containing protein [Dentiradicibacter hellwigii]|uniref:Cell division protein ZipA n=1 Tax=Dentiradicibacter hellwigii TaxID=3149053 RepID=A0ABV4UCW7_9RHOO